MRCKEARIDLQYMSSNIHHINNNNNTHTLGPNYRKTDKAKAKKGQEEVLFGSHQCFLYVLQNGCDGVRRQT